MADSFLNARSKILNVDLTRRHGLNLSCPKSQQQMCGSRRGILLPCSSIIGVAIFLFCPKKAKILLNK
jgi:hypothetical protein